MFLTEERFNSMRAGNLNGTEVFENILSRLPKDIVINDWHYFDRGKIETFAFLVQKGFPVYGATWCNRDNIVNFTRQVILELPYEQRGMIATTWPGALWHKRKRLVEAGADLLSVDEIIDFSGKVYWHGE